jgi:putative heme-binding domain-containing protein
MVILLYPCRMRSTLWKKPQPLPPGRLFGLSAFLMGLVLLNWLQFSYGNTADRAPWTTSTIIGSPEPPDPYRAERVFPKLTFQEPVEISSIPGSNYFLALEREGKVYAFPHQADPEERFLMADLGEVTGQGGEIYSIAFHPQFAGNRHVYASLFIRQPAPPFMRISRFVLNDSDPPALDLASETPIIEWPSDGHNGCSLAFGKDGYLYISTGDGAGPAPPDPLKAGQDLSNLLSCILRIDVDQTDGSRPYRVPPDNPFIHHPGARPEIWAYGFRNPWKISVDPRDGALWVADVGWEAWEMIFRIDEGGFNGGWSIVEGPQPVNTTWQRGPTPIRSPLISHPHTEAASITGGLVYQGKRLPELFNSYIYGDWETGKIWELHHHGGTVTRRRELATTPFRIVGFGQDHDGELYFADYTGGGIYRLVPSESIGISSPDFPRILSQTGLFQSTKNYEFAPGVFPYSIRSPAWADHASADYAIAVPERESVLRDGGHYLFPTNTVFLRTFSMEMKAGDPASRRRIETQLLHFEGGFVWNAYSYRWGKDQSDAELVAKEGAEQLLEIHDNSAPHNLRNQVWRFHSRSECMRCHMDRFGFVNGYIAEQLETPPQPVPASTNTNQLELLQHLGLVSPAPRKKFGLANPYDHTAPLEMRARSWLHSNCAHCHREYASGAVMMFLHAEMLLEKTLTAGHPPNRGAFGISNPEIIAKGDPLRSALLYRVMTPSGGRMPILGSSMIDQEGILLLRDWIASLPQVEGTKNQTHHFNQTLRELQTCFQSGNDDWRESIHTLLGNTSAAMGFSLAIHEKTLPADVQDAIVTAASAHPHPAARDLFEPFLPFEQRRKTLGPSFDPQLVLSRQGDSERGARLYFSDQGCQLCHSLMGQGRDFGPDLSRIGAKYNRSELLDHIVHPDQHLDPQWKGWNLETIEGDSYIGFLLENTGSAIRLKIADGAIITLERDQAASLVPQPSSLMPEGLLQSYTAQEAADLIEFLSTLR